MNVDQYLANVRKIGRKSLAEPSLFNFLSQKENIYYTNGIRLFVVFINNRLLSTSFVAERL